MGKTIAVAMPQSIEDCAQAIAAYGQADRKLDEIQAALDNDVAGITAAAETRAAPLREERDALFAAVQAFCETRRKELCKGKAKSHKFTTGTVKWRTGKMKAVFEKAKEKLVLNQLIAAGLSNCYETVTKIKKGDIVKTPIDKLKAIEGVTIERSPETFTISVPDVPVDRTGEA